MRDREEVLNWLKFHLARAQNRMRQQANTHRSAHEIDAGDYVYVKLHPYKQHSMKPHHSHKLLPKFYGPYRVIDKINSAAYQLQFPPKAKIHNVLHVSQLKLCPNPSATAVIPLPIVIEDVQAP